MSDLYQAAIVAAAREAVGAGRLREPAASVTLDNPLCGDRVTIDLHLADGRVEAVGHEIRGCLLCEAAASIIGTHAPGTDVDALAGVAERARRMFERDPCEPPAWEALAMFEPVRRYRSRQRCVTLPFETLAQALAEADAGE